METYDEDLTENPFFQILQSEQTEVFRRATAEGWIICVPRAGSVPKYALSHEDIFGHILIPSDELPESHFRTLNDKEVRILNRVITVEEEDVSRPYVTHILFEETFYTDDLKYKVLCIDSPLEKNLNFGCAQNDLNEFLCINTLRDSIDLLWTECGGHILENLDQCVKDFIASNLGFENEPLGVLKHLISNLYIQCLQITLQDVRLREKISSHKHLLHNVKLSVETYLHRGIYKQLIKGITTCTAIEDSHLNKIIRNLADIQLRDLGIRTDLYGAVPWAKQELARIDCYSTVLGKIGCLKRMVSAISQKNGGSTKEMRISDAISADDLLPIFVFLIVKTGLPNWIAHLTYIKEFHFSASLNSEVDEHNFLVTTLEAAIEHIKGGLLFGPAEPEGDIVKNEDGSIPSCQSNTHLNLDGSLKSCGIGHFFDQVRLGNIEYVKEVLERKKMKDESHNLSPPQLCHPLCSCDKCESTLSKRLCDTSPTINSCDDHGFTALHIASLTGQHAMVDLLVNLGSKVDATDYSSSTPLHYAAAKGHQNAVLLLVHSGCNIEVYDNDGNTPLHLASNNGHEGCVKALLYFAEHVSVHLDVNCVNSCGDTPLHHASRWGYEGIVQILLDYGAKPNIRNKRHLTSLDVAHSMHISRILIQEMRDVRNFHSLKPLAIETGKIINGGSATSSRENLDFCEGLSPGKQQGIINKNVQTVVRPQSTDQMKQIEKVLRAIAHGDIRLACFYMGLDTQSPSADFLNDVNSFCHPLCNCDKCKPTEGCTENANNCIGNSGRKSMNVNICNSEGFTALHVAAMHGHTEMVRVLMDAGSHTNVHTRSKRVTPLHLACQNQRVPVVQLLLQSSECDVNLQDSRGNTPLHYACYTGNMKLVRLILKADPRLAVRNNNGKTPREEAEENMAISLVHVLKNAEAIFQQ